ncbi:MAG: cell division protein ZapA [Bacteroidetes bacterium]|nr:cell division protein ZapA [Bacteroidota bacterium]
MSEVNIKVEIAGSTFPVKVNMVDQANIEEAINLINTKIAEFEKAYAIKDKKDVLAMVMLQLVAQLYKQATTAENELSNLKQVLDDVKVMLAQHNNNISNINNE